jgi:O-acetylserine/cysteine efflux transporter
MNLRDTLLTTIVVVIWGVNFVVVKLGVQELPPLLLTGIRFACVAAVAAPFFRLPQGKLPLVIGLSALLGVGHFGLLFVGITGLDAATAAITIQLCVPFSAIVAALVYRERLGWAGALGMTLSLFGVALLAGEPTRPDLLSLALVAAAAMAWAWSNVLVKKIGPINGLALNGWMALFAAPQLILLSAIFEHGQVQAIRHAGWAGWGAVAFTAGAASLTAYTLWYRLIARHPVNRVVPFTLLGPVIGVAAGVMVLGEPLGWHKLVGGALTIAGVAIVQFRPSPAPKDQPA